MQTQENPTNGIGGAFGKGVLVEEESTRNTVQPQAFTPEEITAMVEARAAVITGNSPAKEGTGVCSPVPQVFPIAVQKLLDEATDAFAVPAEVPTATFLALLSCLVGRTRAISPKRGWVEHGNVWIVIVAPSGLGKTPVMNAFFKPIAEYEYRRSSEWKKAYERYSIEMLNFSRAKKGEAGDPPQKPARTQYYIDEATLESVGDALAENPRGIMWRVDELSGFLAGFDRYSSGKEGGTRARLLSAYDCQEWKSNRRDVAKNIHIPAACVSIFGGLQPDMMARVFGKTDADVGFLPRFMFIHAEREKPALWSETSLSAGSEQLLRRIVECLTGFELVAMDSGEQVPAVFRLSSEAKTLFVGWYDKQALENWKRLSEGVADALGQKLKGHALRLCLLLHCLDIALGEMDDMSPVPADTMRRALWLAEWVKENQLKALALLSGDKSKHGYSPTEKAVMEAVVVEAERCGVDSLIVPNARLVELVNGILPYPVDARVIGKAAGTVGLAVAYAGKERARKATPENISLFKTHVGNVGDVGTPCAATVSSSDMAKKAMSVMSVDGVANE